MRLPRVIPVLLFRNNGLVKTFKFKTDKYVGDPVNAIKILNEKEIDELFFLDIDGSKLNSEPNYKVIEDIASECFMPLCYGGAIRNVEQAKTILSLGVEKISLNSVLYEDINILKELSSIFGSQSIVGSIDVKKNILGKYVLYSHGGKKKEGKDLLSHLKELEDAGAGEILINSIDRDGQQIGYDDELIKLASSYVNIPLVACGGAGHVDHLKTPINNGASAVAAGSLFVFMGKHKAVLINYPSRIELKRVFHGN